jgi:hypothetical protein
MIAIALLALIAAGCVLLAASSFLWAAFFRLPNRTAMKHADEFPKN